MKFKYDKRLEWLRLINHDLAVRTGMGQARNDDSGELVGDVEHYMRARFAYPNRVENVHVTFTDEKSARTARGILLDRLKVLANESTGTNERYNDVIRDFLKELQDNNPTIQEFIKGSVEQLIVAPSTGEEN